MRAGLTYASVGPTDMLDDLVALLVRPQDAQGVFADSDRQTLERARALAAAVVRRREDDARKVRGTKWAA